MKIKTLMLAVSAAAACGMVSSAYAEDGLYGAAMASYVLRDANLPVHGGYGGQFVLGGPISERLNWEGNVFFSENKTDNIDGRIPTLGVGADLRYALCKTGWRPFVLGGLGVQQENYADAGGDKQNSPFIDLGVGVDKKLGDTFGLRAELRSYVIQYKEFPGQNAAFDFRLNVGFSFGGSASAAAPVAHAAATPAAPAPAVAKAAAPAAVAAAPAASTKPAPKCKAVKGQAVDAQGCPVLDKLSLQGVNFAFRSDVIEKKSLPILDGVVSTLKAHPEVNVEVHGYTDSSGDAKRNEGLSQRRADAVMKYFVAHGIDAKRLSAKGHGQADPIAPNDTEANRAKNRRVELKVK